MKKNSGWKTKAVLLLLLTTFLAINFQQAFAFEEGGFVKKEKAVRIGKDTEIFIGNGGVFIDDSPVSGTLVVKAREPVNRGWQVFTQRILEVRVFDEDGREYDQHIGLIRVYFNLDAYQRNKWEDPASNMSIWVFDEIHGGWSKCKTRVLDSAQFRKGRLYCYVKGNGLYGLAWTKPTLRMKLEKAKANN